MISKVLFIMAILKLAVMINATPIPRCEDVHDSSINEPCLLLVFTGKSEKLAEDGWPNDVQFVQRRNSELSSALNFLYGNNKFPGKRNPELSSALMKYINSHDKMN